ncbi:SRPBCC family protein [Nonomuraea sp. NPDC052265]|uniref:SRPBCC family protein n=1 Tax=Nonomuraea sp. NPDC052265 TaxID=3364374 RepID=UPI0037CAC4B7
MGTNRRCGVTVTGVELSGRRAELEQLSSFLGSARRHGDARLMRGEPGVGKSVLMGAAAELVVTADMRVLRASGSEFEADISYSCLNQLLLPVNADIERLPPGLREALSVALGFGVGTPADALLVCNAALLLVKVVAAEVEIAAPLQRVWHLHTDVNSWPSWQSDITEATADGPLEAGSVFRWSTFGLDITSTVHAVEAPQRILWGGPAHGITGVHQWTFTERNGVVLVETEESWDGEPVLADLENMRAALNASLTSWLIYLKTAAEQPLIH